ncbi:hypothetical protein MMC25_005694 [Agyrium rufum]|nr:hypothetical protein [Agyrium rufum]
MDYAKLRVQTLGSGAEEEAVTVNTRALIDKVLARYAGEWTVLRELLQNAADASASKVTIKFETIPSASVPLPQSPTPSALIKHTLLHHTLRRLVVTNDGNPFAATDWNRLTKIAEGNPDETKIGAFGVGFYSVFADCEEPFVSSGNEALAFYWKGNALYTRRLHLTPEQASKETSFVLDYRNTTSPVPSLLPLCEFLASSLTFVGLTNIELWLDDCMLLNLTKLAAPGTQVSIPKRLRTKTAENIMTVDRVEREVAQLNAKWLKVVFWKKTLAGAENNVVVTKTGTQPQSLRSFFSKFSTSNANAAAEKLAREERIAQEAIVEDLLGECSATVFLHVNTATIRTSCAKAFAQELERATKKPPPKSTKIAVLTSSYNESSVSSQGANDVSRTDDVFSSVLPNKAGKIYIGFPTHQTTGICAHISAQSVIPTVERESIDLNARWVKSWNQELLRAAGIVCRIAWSGEIDTLRTTLHGLSEKHGNKVQTQDIDHVLPQATHVFNQYTFKDSTPSSQVGTLIEDAFWTCSLDASIDILSSKGILPVQDVRLALDDLSFLDNIPVLPKELIKNANGFFQKLISYGLVSEITEKDIRKALENQALNSRQLREFLHWIGRRARIADIDPATVNTLFAATVVNDEAAEENSVQDRRLVILGDIKHFINPSKIPANVPVPPNTIPFKFTNNIPREDLEALGWEDLQIVPWLRWLVESTSSRGLPEDQDLTKSASFAALILPVISKQWDGLSQSSKGTAIELLGIRTVIPTKLGMRKPKDAYFPSVKLFEDLPVVFGLNGVKEKLLATLGVRKTIELGLIFDRLMAPPEYEKDLDNVRPSWSHVDLVRYLAGARNDIPAEDIKRLRTTPLCPAEATDRGKATVERYLVTELFEPTDVLRSLGLRIMHWPGNYRTGSEEGRFLTFLGLRRSPSVPELIGIMSNAVLKDDFALRDRALRYFINFHHPNGYSGFNLSASNAAFLPLDGHADSRFVMPSQCYTNEAAAMMGYDILRRDLHPHALKLGVAVNPPIQSCVDRLIGNPPPRHRDARELFQYLATRLAEIPMKSDLQMRLSKASIVPVAPSTSNGVPVSEKAQNRLITPSMCFLGNDRKYAELFDYADFGNEANTFLLRCGASHEPKAIDIAKFVIREPARLFNKLDSIEKYLELLRTLAISWPVLKNDRTLVQEMRTASFLLASREYPSQAKKGNKPVKGDSLTYEDDDEAGIRTYQLASGKEIVIIDDVISYNLFKSSLLAAPLEETLENFYQSLGARSLRDLVEEQTSIGQTLNDQSDAQRVKKLVNERIKLFLHEISKEKIKHDAAWVEKKLEFVCVRSITVKLSLKGIGASHKDTKGAAAMYDPNKGWTLYFSQSRSDNFDISTTLVQLLLNKTKPQQAIMLDVLLSTDLQKLRARGYNVERILQRRAAEARIEEQNRRQQLEKEQALLKEQEAEWMARQTERELNPIPGFFPDSPDRNSVAGSYDANPDLPISPPEMQRNRRSKGLFTEITRRLGINDQRSPTMPEPDRPESSSAVAPPPYSQGPNRPPVIEKESLTPNHAVTAPQHLQQNLRSAIQSSRAFNSNSVTTQPNVHDVKETQSYCDSTPGQNIRFVAEAPSGVRIFLANQITDQSKFMAQNASALGAFADLLLDCAQAFGLVRSSINIFHDPAASTIAFNQNKSLFCNYHFFESFHLAAVQQGHSSDALIYWFVVLCHELAHNLVSDHNSAHSYYTESFAIEYFGKVAAKLTRGTDIGSGTSSALSSLQDPLFRSLS